MTSLKTTTLITLNLVALAATLLTLKSPPPPPPRAAADAAVFAGKIVSGQFDEENPFVLISSRLLVQPNEGVSDLVMDRIGDNLPQSTEKSWIIVIPVGARHKCQQVPGRTIVHTLAHVSDEGRASAPRDGAAGVAPPRATMGEAVRCEAPLLAVDGAHSLHVLHAARCACLRAASCAAVRNFSTAAATPASLRRCRDGWSEFF
ncbi:hypothetical protein F511_42830 [Dorcoceras hygrometricum]|uniref:Uncharacterized protein n=1 Tax=Dorcoceras hygrometricum TaxID=472368 RepID=A0A2Z7B2G1_9LAMI|nr:hypothetical protein F511_42830 [Dorcoceras hygrometricum]